MSKKSKTKKNSNNNKIDPFTNANDIQKSIVDKKKGKRTSQEKNRFDRQQQKEIVRQLAAELVELSEKDILEDTPQEINPYYRTNDVVYTIKPVGYRDIDND